MKEVHQAIFTIEEIQQALSGSLPGKTGQEKMAPLPTQGRINRWQLPEHYREAGVLILLYPHTTNGMVSELHIALTRRPEYRSFGAKYSGQLASKISIQICLSDALYGLNVMFATEFSL